MAHLVGRYQGRRWVKRNLVEEQTLGARGPVFYHVVLLSRCASSSLRIYRRGRDDCEVPPEMFLLRKALKSRDTLLDCPQLRQCSGIGSPFGIPSFNRDERVFNSSK